MKEFLMRSLGRYRISTFQIIAASFAGLILLGISAFVRNVIPSAVLGVVGFSCLWSIIELFHQHKRVEKGWFPANPKHHPAKTDTDKP